MNLMRSIFKRTLLPGLLCASSLIWGCGDTLPPAPSDNNDNLAARVIFTYTSKELEEVMHMRLAHPDGSGVTNLGEGAMFGSAGKNRFAFFRNNRVYAATWRNGQWDIINIPFSTSGYQGDHEISIPSIAVSPDGTLLTFTVDEEVNDSTVIPRTYLGGSDGSGVGEPLGISLANDCTPVFSRDGRKMVLYGTPAGARGKKETAANVYVLDIASRTYTMLAAIGPAKLTVPGWIDFSPDGSKVVYADGSVGEIYIANADGSGVPRLLAQSGFYPVWSPKGDNILYIGSVSGSLDILMKKADGSGGAVNLTNSIDRVELFPQFSPDGSMISYTVYPEHPRSVFGVGMVADVNNQSAPRMLDSLAGKIFWVRTGE